MRRWHGARWREGEGRTAFRHYIHVARDKHHDHEATTKVLQGASLTLLLGRAPGAPGRLVGTVRRLERDASVEAGDVRVCVLDLASNAALPCAGSLILTS
jgi:hypothetical protein